MNLRQRKRAATRKKLATISLELFLRDGFDETTVESIAAIAEVSARTFFRYFPTKEAAFFDNQQSRLEAFVGLLDEPREGESASDRVFRVCLEMADAFQQDSETMLAQYQVMFNSRHLLAHDLQLDLQWEEAIAKALAEGSQESEVQASARMRAGAIIGVVRAELRHWYRSECNFDIVERGQAAFAQLRSANLGLPEA